MITEQRPCQYKSTAQRLWKIGRQVKEMIGALITTYSRVLRGTISRTWKKNKGLIVLFRITK